MSSVSTVNTFSGGMNRDLSEMFIPSDSYVEARNIVGGVPTKDGGYIVEIEKGNERAFLQLPSGVNTCIGATADEQDNYIFFFIANSNGDHSIHRYETHTKVVTRVVYPIVSGQTIFLNFQIDKRIINSKFVRIDPDNELLYWTDGYFVNDELPYDIQTPSNSRLKDCNPPRCVNVQMAIRLTNALPGKAYPPQFYTSNLYEQNQFIDAIRYPSIYAPTGVFESDPTRGVNYLRDKQPPQFRIRYRYYSGEYSVWGGISEVVLPYNQEYIDNYQGGNIFLNNKVVVSYNTGHPSAAEIDIAVRFGNTGLWYKIDSINKYDKNFNRLLPDFAQETFDFYNDKVLTPISVEAASQPYDYVPIAAGCQEFITTSDTNVFAYGDIIEGRDLPDPDVDIEFVERNERINTYTKMGAPSVTVNTIADPISTVNILSFGTQLAIAVRSDIPINLYFFENSVVTISIPTSFAGAAVVKDFVISAQDVLNVTTTLDVANWIASKISTITTLNVSVQSRLASGVLCHFVFEPGGINYSIVYRVPLQKTSELKRGAEHSWGLIYEDEAGRMSTVVPCGKIYTPHKCEMPSYQGQVYRQDIYGALRPSFVINHKPPSWARKYRIAYGGNNIKRYTQLSSKAAAVVSGKIEWDITNWGEYLVSIAPTSLSPIAPYSNGRLRLLVDKNGLIQEDLIDMRVLASSTETSIHTPLTDITNFDVGGLVEYYEYKQEQDVIYNEYSQAFDVLFDGNEWYHAGNVQNQTSLQPAIVELPYGDSYIKKRVYLDAYPSGSILFTAPITDAQFSDFYRSDSINIGRVNLFDPNFKQRHLKSVFRFSRNFIYNSGQLGLNSFNENDLQELSPIFGRLTAMRIVGYVMKCLQETKNTSIYIKRRQVYSADGSPMLATTDATIGSVNVSDDVYGCQHPESIAVFNRHLYYFDANSSVVVRDAPNGQFPISAYGMSAFFNDISPSVTKAIGIWDRYKGRYLLTIDNTTLSFEEAKNAWRSFHDYIPDTYAGEGTNLISFTGAALWVHHSDNVPLAQFYGTKYRAVMEFIARPDPALATKVFDAVELHSNKEWVATDGNGSYGITTPERPNAPQGMKSRIGKFHRYENHFTASLLFDANTPNKPTEEVALLNGRRLRDYFLRVRLENNSDDYVQLLMFATKGVISQ